MTGEPERPVRTLGSGPVVRRSGRLQPGGSVRYQLAGKLRRPQVRRAMGTFRLLERRHQPLPPTREPSRHILGSPYVVIDTDSALRWSRSVEGADRAALQLPVARSGMPF